MRYWVLDQEELRLTSIQELEFAMEDPLEITGAQYKELCASGGMFSANSDIGSSLDGG